MFILDIAKEKYPSDPSHITASFDAYRAYLNSVRDKLPDSAFSFASAAWHYDAQDSRCPHDSWVEELIVNEPSSGEQSERRGLEIRLRLLGAYHDGHIELTYPNVLGYSLMKPGQHHAPGRQHGHGDWLIDEVRLSEQGGVLHEIAFSHGSHWQIECDDIEYRWLPLQGDEGEAE